MISDKELTLKTVFALASGKRRSELHALSRADVSFDVGGYDTQACGVVYFEDADEDARHRGVEADFHPSDAYAG